MKTVVQKVSTFAYCNVFASAVGLSLGALTFGIRWLAVISDNHTVAEIQRFLFALIVPGIVGSAACGGNVHVWYIWAAAMINGVFYFCLGWIACLILIKALRTLPTASG